MKRKVAIVVLALLVWLSCWAPASAQGMASLTVYNYSEAEICYLYLVPANAWDWGEDLLGLSTIPPGGWYTIPNIFPGIYNLWVENCEGGVQEEYNAALLAGSYRIVYENWRYEEEEEEEEEVPLTIKNEMGQEICYVYIADIYDTGWGSDWLGEEETIPSGWEWTTSLPAGTYNILLKDCDKNVLKEYGNISIEKGITMTIPPLPTPTSIPTAAPTQTATSTATSTATPVLATPTVTPTVVLTPTTAVTVTLTPTPTFELVVTNVTTQMVQFIMISPPGEDWGQNRISYPITQTGRVTMTLSVSEVGYDLLAADPQGQEIEEHYGVLRGVAGTVRWEIGGVGIIEPTPTPTPTLTPTTIRFAKATPTVVTTATLTVTVVPTIPVTPTVAISVTPSLVLTVTPTVTPTATTVVTLTPVVTTAPAVTATTTITPTLEPTFTPTAVPPTPTPVFKKKPAASPTITPVR